MSNYRFSIHRYHAIEEADVVLDGITVLAGPNGSGKSTISRWLYYVIDVATEFDRYLVQEYRDEVNSLLQRMSRVSREMWGVGSGKAKVNMAFRQKMESLIPGGALSLGNIEEYSEKLLLLIDDFSEQLRIFCLDESIADSRKQRVANYLGFGSIGEGNGSFDIAFCTEYKQLVESLKKRVLSDRDARSMEKFRYFLREQLNEEDEIPAGLSLEEDGVEILMGNRFGEFLNIEKAIYIDTPMAFEPEGFVKNAFWARLRNFMMKAKGDAPRTVTPLLARIMEILKGKIKVKEGLFDYRELYYERSDGKLALPLDKVATGMKTFAYLFQLLKNGHLDDKTVLMIDEPEVHLHPQWVVMFARLLVLIHKKLGAKVVLASHNPNFVAAVKAISQKEGVQGDTHFYLSEEGADGHFSFRDLGMDIEPIFESFNIALERIRQYGDTDF